MKRFFGWVLTVLTVFIANEAAHQVLTAVILGFVIGGALNDSNYKFWLISASVALFLSLCAQLGRRYYRDKTQPYRIQKIQMSLKFSQGGDHVLFEHDVKFRVRQSEVKKVVRMLTWSGTTNLAANIHDCGSGYRMRAVHVPGTKNTAQITFEFDEPVKRFRSATIAIQAHLDGETGFISASGGELSYKPNLSSDSGMEAQSLFSRINLNISWDDTLEPNWNRITWKEFRGSNDIALKHSPLRSGKGEEVRLKNSKNTLGVTVKPNTFNTYLCLYSSFTKKV